MRRRFMNFIRWNVIEQHDKPIMLSHFIYLFKYDNVSRIGLLDDWMKHHQMWKSKYMALQNYVTTLIKNFSSLSFELILLRIDDSAWVSVIWFDSNSAYEGFAFFSRIKMDTCEDDKMETDSIVWMCPHGCPQPFVKKEYLQLHIKRRHTSEEDQMSAKNSVDVQLSQLSDVDVIWLKSNSRFVKEKERWC